MHWGFCFWASEVYFALRKNKKTIKSIAFYGIVFAGVGLTESPQGSPVALSILSFN